MVHTISDLISPETLATLSDEANISGKVVLDKVDGMVTSIRVGNSKISWNKHHECFQIFRSVLRNLRVDQLFCDATFLIRHLGDNGFIKNPYPVDVIMSVIDKDRVALTFSESDEYILTDDPRIIEQQHLLREEQFRLFLEHNTKPFRSLPFNSDAGVEWVEYSVVITAQTFIEVLDFIEGALNKKDAGYRRYTNHGLLGPSLQERKPDYTYRQEYVRT